MAKAKRVYDWVSKNIFFVAWVFASISLLGSISLSEIWGFHPCRLCWYQRIILIIVVIMLGVVEYKKAYRFYKFILPIIVIGWGIALYQSLLQWGFISESLTCDIDAPCSIAQISWLGFITIPFMSLVVFSVLIGLMILQHLQFAKKETSK